jgi:hypothetical protein
LEFGSQETRKELDSKPAMDCEANGRAFQSRKERCLTNKGFCLEFSGFLDFQFIPKFLDSWLPN